MRRHRFRACPLPPMPALGRVCRDSWPPAAAARLFHMRSSSKRSSTPTPNSLALPAPRQVDFRDAATFEVIKTHVCDGYEVESASFAPEKGK